MLDKTYFLFLYGAGILLGIIVSYYLITKKGQEESTEQTALLIKNQKKIISIREGFLSCGVTFMIGNISYEERYRTTACKNFINSKR